MLRDRKVNVPAAPVQDRANPHDNALPLLYQVDNLTHRPACRRHVLYSQNTLPWQHLQATSQRHHSLLALAKQRPDAEGPGDFLANDNPTNGRGYHGIKSQVTKTVGNPPSERFGMLGVL
jgi:hypothetical protein